MALCHFDTLCFEGAVNLGGWLGNVFYNLLDDLIHKELKLGSKEVLTQIGIVNKALVALDASFVDF